VVEVAAALHANLLLIHDNHQRQLKPPCGQCRQNQSVPVNIVCHPCAHGCICRLPRYTHSACGLNCVGAIGHNLAPSLALNDSLYCSTLTQRHSPVNFLMLTACLPSRSPRQTDLAFIGTLTGAFPKPVWTTHSGWYPLRTTACLPSTRTLSGCSKIQQTRPLSPWPTLFVYLLEEGLLTNLMLVISVEQYYYLTCDVLSMLVVDLPGSTNGIPRLFTYCIHQKSS
jgi:hypothetical protein